MNSASVLIKSILLGHLLLAAEEIPEEAKPIFAATKIFDIKTHLRQTIDLRSETLAYIGDDFQVSRSKPTDCLFRLSRGSEWKVIQTIDFSKLTGEYRIGPGHYARLTFIGLEGGRAACFLEEGNRCFDDLEFALTSDELTDVLRDMRFIFAKVCTPAEPPL